MKSIDILKQAVQLTHPTGRGTAAVAGRCQLEGADGGSLHEGLKRVLEELDGTEKPEEDFTSFVALLKHVGPSGHLTFMESDNPEEPAFILELLCEESGWKVMRFGDESVDALIAQAFEFIEANPTAGSSKKKSKKKSSE